MKKFSQFVKKNGRRNHTPQYKEFAQHNDKLSQTHKEHIGYYKGESQSTNRYLRRGVLPHPHEQKIDTAAMHDHIKNMEAATSHHTQHHYTVFRGGTRGDISKFPAGFKFHDHGFTGTSFRVHPAAGFSLDRNTLSHSGKPVVHVIHVPPGTKGHYIDVHHQNGDLSADEHEFLLHRGTKFKVTHHSEDRDYHYIHSRVIGQHAKKLDLPKPVPGKNYSFSGYHNYHGEPPDHGITMTKHEDEKNPLVKKKLAKIHGSIAKSKINTSAVWKSIQLKDKV